MRKRFLRIPPDGIAKHDKCSQENLRCETRLPRKEGGHRKQAISILHGHPHKSKVHRLDIRTAKSIHEKAMDRNFANLGISQKKRKKIKERRKSTSTA